jgi:glycosyltransferase involved in cell wall biosynthesis
MLGAKIDSVMRNSSAVVAGNEYLADRARRAGAKRVEILPTVIDIDSYPIRPMPSNEVFTIGWIGSLSTARYLSDIQPALMEVCRDNAARLIPIGIKSLDLEGVPFDLMQPWSEEKEIEESYKFDVGIMPLPDTPWERGKCGLKLIKYMAASRPVIASPVGVNKEIVDHNVNGFIASTLDEWSETLNSLRGDRLMRERMGREGRRKVEAKYCTRVAAPFLADVLRSVVSQQIR